MPLVHRLFVLQPFDSVVLCLQCDQRKIVCGTDSREIQSVHTIHHACSTYIRNNQFYFPPAFMIFDQEGMSAHLQDTRYTTSCSATCTL